MSKQVFVFTVTRTAYVVVQAADAQRARHIAFDAADDALSEDDNNLEVRFESTLTSLKQAEEQFKLLPTQFVYDRPSDDPTTLHLCLPAK